MKITQENKKEFAEYLTFKRLITETYPTGIVSIVSDTFSFWNVVNPDGGIAAMLKDVIMARDGKVVIRPDSGDPVKIVTGYTENEYVTLDGKFYENNGHTNGKELSELEIKGMIVCLYQIFGGTVTSKGYKQLDSHIGAIYGDSITYERAQQICERLEAKGFASTNIVLGIGSYTYQYVTRDTHGFAVKSTYGEVEVNGERKGIEIFKDPKTDNGLKKSAKGLTAVYREGDKFVLKDQATWDEVRNCAFELVFKDGQSVRQWTLAEIRAEVAKSL